MSTDLYPLYPSAIILPAFAAPAILLDIPPMIWHFSQRNVAAGSLILWIVLLNLGNLLNPIIWPRDNLLEWWDGKVFCDIQARIQVGALVALASCAAMVMRRLAKVMDTRNITMAPSRGSKRRELALEILWCWGYPGFMMVLYYIVQPVRYYVFGISGCVYAIDTSWPSIALNCMWNVITMCFAAYFAGLLAYRLIRYRREFHRLVAARNTTKSRFIRLFIMSSILIVFYLPYTFYLLYYVSTQLTDTYSWDRVHGKDWNSIVKVPAVGLVRIDRWGEVVTGYVVFIAFGTGLDANLTYNRILCASGLGGVFPSLLINTSSDSTPSGTPSSMTFTFRKAWATNMSSKARSFFSKTTTTETTGAGTSNNSVAFTSMPNTPQANSLHFVSTIDPIVNAQPSSTENRSFFARLFTRRNPQRPVLPLFALDSINETTLSEKSPVKPLSPRVFAYAWSSDSPVASQAEEIQGVFVLREVHQDHREKTVKEKEKEDHTKMDDWA
ncbi:STE3-domain-containing protein [Pleomassaria siparia CBS 279.74]|uniref:STE3-domain-containing protein n=1 Tax=Pleomassaria siparia CBS 279.74 TaxID=1314801 RepID=A0A6G1KQS6_9PLEO|nr:STE3-domain-containing protein [Pleomassaria siparia CBS 279.74]